MSELTRHRPVLEPVPSPPVTASPFIHEGGQYLAPTDEEAVVPTGQVLNIMQRYEDRLDGLIDKVTGQASEVTGLNKALEAERRAAMGARHRLELTQLDARQRVEEIQNRAEQSRLRASVEVEKQRLQTELHKRDLDRAGETVDTLSKKLELSEQLRRTPWYAYKRRRELEAELTALRKGL